MLTKIHEYVPMYVQPSKMIYRDGKMLTCSTNKPRIVQTNPDGTGYSAFAFGLSGGMFGMALNPTTGNVWASMGGLEHKIVEVHGTGVVNTNNSTRPGELCFAPDGTMYHATFAAGPGSPGDVWKDSVLFYQGSRVVALAADDEDYLYVGDYNAAELVKVGAYGNRVTTMSGVRPVEILVVGLDLFVLMADRSIWRISRDDLSVVWVYNEYPTPPLAATTLAMDGDGDLHLSGFVWPGINGKFGAWVFAVN